MLRREVVGVLQAWLSAEDYGRIMNKEVRVLTTVIEMIGHGT